MRPPVTQSLIRLPQCKIWCPRCPSGSVAPAIGNLRDKVGMYRDRKIMGPSLEVSSPISEDEDGSTPPSRVTTWARKIRDMFCIGARLVIRD